MKKIELKKYIILVVSFLITEFISINFVYKDFYGILNEKNMIDFNVALIKAVLYIAIYILIKSIFYTKNDSESKYIKICATLTFIFGWIGYLNYFYPNLSAYSISDVIYNIILLFSMNVNADGDLNVYLNLARFLAVITVSGFILKLLSNDLFLKAHIKLHFKRHIIVCIDEIDRDTQCFFKILSNTDASTNLMILTKTKTKILDEILSKEHEKNKSKRKIFVLEHEINSDGLDIANFISAEKIYFISKNDEYNMELIKEIKEIKTEKNNSIKLNCFLFSENAEIIDSFYDKYIFRESYDNFDARLLGINKYIADNIVNSNLIFEFTLKEFKIGVIGTGSLFDEVVKQVLIMYSFGMDKKTNSTIYFVKKGYSIDINEYVLEDLRKFIEIVILDDIEELQEKVNIESELDLVFFVNDDNYNCYKDFKVAQELNLKAKKYLSAYKFGDTFEELLNDSNLKSAKLSNVNNDDKLARNLYKIMENEDWNKLPENDKVNYRDAAIHLKQLYGKYYLKRPNVEDAMLNNIIMKDKYRIITAKLINGNKFNIDLVLSDFGKNENYFGDSVFLNKECVKSFFEELEVGGELESKNERERCDSYMKEKQKANYTAYDGDMPYIFLSYSSEDNNRDRAIEIINKLNENSYRVWFEEDILKMGYGSQIDISKKIEECNTFIILISRDIENDLNVINEYRIALANNKPVIPIIIDEDIEFTGNILKNLNNLKKYSINEINYDDFLTNIVKTYEIEDLFEIDGDKILECKQDIEEIVIPDYITTIGEYAFHNKQNLKKIDLRNVKKVEDRAFLYCGNLLEVTMKCVEKIGARAFSQCKNIKSLESDVIKEISNNAFADCISLEKINCSSVESMEYQAFRNCSKLTEVDIRQVKEISDNAFADCISLEKINCSSVESMGDGAFENCSKLTEVDTRQVTSYGKGAFKGCKKIIKINLGELESIEDEMFAECSSLETIESLNLVKIGNNAFENCKSLTKIELGNVTEVGDSTFRNCRSLINVELDKVTKMGVKAFENCELLKNINVENCNKLNYAVFSGCKNIEELKLSNEIEVIPKRAFLNCRLLKKIEIKNIITIADMAFLNCENLQYIYTGNVKTIGSHAFENCKSIESVDLGNANDIRTNVFDGCLSLSDIVLSDEIEIIYQYTFRNCKKLRKINLENIEIIGSYAFYGCKNLAGVSFSKKLKCIPGFCFSECIALTNINLYNSVNLRRINQGAFMNCYNLEKVELSSSVRVDNGYFISDGVIGKDAFKNCEKLKGISLNNFTIIYADAFLGCVELEKSTKGILSKYLKNGIL